MMPNSSELADSPTRSDILYKLGQIEAKLEITRMGWIEPVQKIERLLEKLEHNINQDLVIMKNEQDQIKRDITTLKEKEIASLKNEISTWKTRFSTAIAIVSVAWIVFGNTVSSLINRLF